MVAADRIAGKIRPASVGHVVEDDVRLLPRVDLAQGDQTVEAVLEHRSPGRDRVIDRVEILLRDAWLSLDRDRQVGVVPGVTVGIEVAEDDQGLGVGLGQAAVDTRGGRLGVGRDRREERGQHRADQNGKQPAEQHGHSPLCVYASFALFSE